MSLRRAAAGLSLLVLAAGCAMNETREPPRPLVEFTPYYTLEEVWNASAASDTEHLYLGLRPASDGERVYAASHDGTVTAYALASGEQLWETELETGGEGWFELARGLPLSAGPSVAHGMLAVGTADGEVVLLAADTGELRWISRVGGEVLAPPLILEDRIILRTVDGRLVALAAVDGAQLWVHEQTVPALSLRGNAAPVGDGGLVFAGFDNGKLAALDVGSGRLLWEQPLATPTGRTELERMVDVDGRMVYREGVLYAVAYNGNLAALEGRSGRPLWTQEMSSHKGLDADRQAVYVTDENSVISVHDARSGGVLWRSEELRARLLTAPVRFRDAIAVGDLEGYVHLLSTDTGLMLARAETDGSRIIAPPLAVGGLLLVQTEAGGLYAFRIRE